MATYVALTTINSQNGWREVLRGNDKEKVFSKAREMVDETSNFTQVEQANLFVTSLTKAKNVYRFNEVAQCPYCGRPKGNGFYGITETSGVICECKQ